MPAVSHGWIEVIAGCMFSGKTEELIRRVRRAEMAKQKVRVVKPKIDNRYDKAYIVSHSGVKFTAFCTDHPEWILSESINSVQVVAIDEGQFFADSIVNVAERLVSLGKRVIIAGLDLDFRGEPFGPMPTLLARADKVDKLTAICMQCGEEATRTQRIVSGKPAHYCDPVILVGATDYYQARCRAHHIVYKNSNLSIYKGRD